jgi:enterochelin esterase-like enzyme
MVIIETSCSARSLARAGAFAVMMSAAFPQGSVAGEASPLRLNPGASVEVNVAATAPVHLDAGARPGDYVAGVVDAGGSAATLELLKDGKPVRRFFLDAAGRSDFRYVVDESVAMLRISTKGEVHVIVRLEKRIGVSEQGAPKAKLASPIMADLARSVAAGERTDAFWRMVAEKGAPLVEPGPDSKAIVTFLARGAKHGVRILGAPSSDHDPMERLADSDVWFKTYLLPSSTRLSYKLAPDAPDFPGTERERRVAILATAKADPLNRAPWPVEASDAYNQSSTVSLPDAPAQPWIAPAGARSGTPSSLTFASEKLGNIRDVTIYTPPDFNPADPETVLLFVFDGREYQSKVPTPLILDNMIAARVIPPTVAVFIPNIDGDARATELPGNATFADALAEELLPKVLAATKLAGNPARTALAGSSFGGLASSTIALRHPEAFGNVISLSGSYWWHPEGTDPARDNHVATLVASTPRRDLRFFLSAGLFESRGGGRPSILETNRHLRDVLEAKGYAVIAREYAGGHDYLVWRGALSDGLLALFGTQNRP